MDNITLPNINQNLTAILQPPFKLGVPTGGTHYLPVTEIIVIIEFGDGFDTGHAA